MNIEEVQEAFCIKLDYNVQEALIKEVVSSDPLGEGIELLAYYFPL